MADFMTTTGISRPATMWSNGSGGSGASTNTLLNSGIFQNERVMQLLDMLRTISDEKLQEFYDVAKDVRHSKMPLKERFSHGLKAFEKWDEEVQIDLEREARTMFPTIQELYKFSFAFYVYESHKGEKARKFRIKELSLGMFLKLFFVRLSRAEEVKSLRYFDPSFQGMDKHHLFVHAMRGALIDASQLALDFVEHVTVEDEEEEEEHGEDHFPYSTTQQQRYFRRRKGTTRPPRYPQSSIDATESAGRIGPVRGNRTSRRAHTSVDDYEQKQEDEEEENEFEFDDDDEEFHPPPPSSSSHPHHSRRRTKSQASKRASRGEQQRSRAPPPPPPSSSAKSRASGSRTSDNPEEYTEIVDNWVDRHAPVSKKRQVAPTTIISASRAAANYGGVGSSIETRRLAEDIKPWDSVSQVPANNNNNNNNAAAGARPPQKHDVAPLRGEDRSTLSKNNLDKLTAKSHASSANNKTAAGSRRSGGGTTSGAASARRVVGNQPPPASSNKRAESLENRFERTLNDDNDTQHNNNNSATASYRESEVKHIYPDPPKDKKSRAGKSRASNSGFF